MFSIQNSPARKLPPKNNIENVMAHPMIPMPKPA